MVDSKIYEDIAKRTNGDIYIGVVGPVRTGKSSFIRQFMNTMVLPSIDEGSRKERIIDELPQSGDGKVIMTTQPKFVPDGGVKIKLNNTVETNIRLIDCVGYPYDGVSGFIEEGKERNIQTPWSNVDMPFSEAAILGTDKVMKDHSTIGIVVTQDGSIQGIDRKLFINEEEEIINKMKSLEKPFIILLNSIDKYNKKAISLRNELEEKYKMPVVLENVQKMDVESFERILNEILKEFPLKYIDIDIPRYLEALPKDNKIIIHILDKIRNEAANLKKMSDYDLFESIFNEDEYIDSTKVSNLDYGSGKMQIELVPNPKLFYDVISDQSGQNIEDEFKLISYIKELAHAKKEYEKIKNAIEDADEYGYGIVIPKENDMIYDEPDVYKKGNKCSVKMKAEACSYHIMKIDVETEVSPIFGGKGQNEEMVQSWLDGFENNYDELWQSNMFGKTLKTLAQEGIETKLTTLSDDVKFKMRKTINKIVNDGKGGVICLLL